MPKRFKKVYIEISMSAICNVRSAPKLGGTSGLWSRRCFKSGQRGRSADRRSVFPFDGEPLLHPEFDAYLAFCQTLGLPVNLTTNGILLNDARIQALMSPALRQINFSLQSFESNFPEGDNTVYLQKIFDFTERALVERPDLYINYRLWNLGAQGADQSNEKTLQKIRTGLKSDFKAAVDVRWRKSVHIKGRVYLHGDSRFQWPHPAQPVRSTTGFCHGLSSHIGILADGTVVPCCLDKEGVISLGNCSSQKIDDIIQSPRATAIHDGFQKGLLVEDLCQKCTFISRFDNKRPTAALGIMPA